MREGSKKVLLWNQTLKSANRDIFSLSTSINVEIHLKVQMCFSWNSNYPTFFSKSSCSGTVTAKEDRVQQLPSALSRKLSTSSSSSCDDKSGLIDDDGSHAGFTSVTSGSVASSGPHSGGKNGVMAELCGTPAAESNPWAMQPKPAAKEAGICK